LKTLINIPLVETKGDEYKQIASSHRDSHHPFYSNQFQLIASFKKLLIKYSLG